MVSKVLVLRVGAVQLQLGLQRHAVSQTALDALRDAVSGWIDEVVQEFQYKLVPGVRDGKVLVEHLEQALRVAVLGLGLKLEELAEGPQLNVKKIRIRNVRSGSGERMSLLQLWRQHGVRLNEGGTNRSGAGWLWGAPCEIQGTRRSDRDLRPA